MMKLNLKGLRVLNTRPEPQNQALNQLILEANGRPVSLPSINIQALNNNWLNLLPSLKQVSLAIFISSNAVAHSLPVLLKNKIFWPEEIKLIAVGKATAEALSTYHLNEIIVPETSGSESLLQLGCLQEVEKQTILLFKGEGGRTLIAEGLKKRGAHLVELEVYRRIRPDFAKQDLEKYQQALSVDIIIFTSEEAMQNIFTFFGTEAYNRLIRIPVLVISSRLKKIASQFGIQKIITCEPDKILEGIEKFARNKD